MQFFFALQVNHHAILDREISAESAIQLDRVVHDLYCLLPDDTETNPRSSYARQASYADSSNPGPSFRCTLIAAPIILPVSSLVDRKGLRSGGLGFVRGGGCMDQL